MQLTEILTHAVNQQASDILIIAGMPITYKRNGKLVRDPGERVLPNDTQHLLEEIYALANHRSIQKLSAEGDDDFSFSVPGLARFRVNALRQRGSLGAVIRVVTFELPDHERMHIPNKVLSLVDLPKGLLLITGAAGSGKTTTLACLVNHVNTTRSAHIITIEDPIEYLHQHKMSVVIQRELSTDTLSYDIALRAALREAPDIILLGEMRDAETIRAAVTAAETGHLVISTLHTIGAANSIDRIIDAFPPEQQQQIRVQLSQVLEGVVSQTLLSTLDGSITPAFEIMTVNTAIRTMIRESKSHQLDNVIASSSDVGMISMDQSLLALVRAGRVSPDEALVHSVNSDWLTKRLGGAQ
ncbi:MAG: PilT/PilU family type 4a pilus ATPase [Evtepia sp.]